MRYLPHRKNSMLASRSHLSKEECPLRISVQKRVLPLSSEEEKRIESARRRLWSVTNACRIAFAVFLCASPSLSIAPLCHE